MSTKQSIMEKENMPVMKMETDFMKYMSTPLRAFGLSYVLGLDPIGEFLKKNCPFIWHFLNLFII